MGTDSNNLDEGSFASNLAVSVSDARRRANERWRYLHQILCEIHQALDDTPGEDEIGTIMDGLLLSLNGFGAVKELQASQKQALDVRAATSTLVIKVLLNIREHSPDEYENEAREAFSVLVAGSLFNRIDRANDVVAVIEGDRVQACLDDGMGPMKAASEAVGILLGYSGRWVLRRLATWREDQGSQ